MNNIYSIVSDFLILPLTIIIAILGISYIIKGSKSLKYLSYYFVVAFIVQVIQYGLAKNGIHNIFLFHLFTPVQFLLISLNFYHWEKDYTDLYKVSIGLLTVLISLACIHTFPANIFHSSAKDMPTLAMVMSSFAITIFAVRAMIVMPKDHRIYFAFGVLFYFSQSAGFFYLYQITNISLPLIEHKFAVVVSYIIFIIGYINASRSK